ncbi:MAG: T9SS type A sorting domain-containing protein, partial [Flavobacteriaceae bacterium]
ILFFPLWNGAGWDPAAVTTTHYDNVSGLAYNPSSYDVLEDFETTLPAGAIVADGTEAPTVVADPAANGTNGDVMKIVTSTAGESWQNSQLFFQEESLDLTTTDKVVTVDVYSDVATSILAKTASGLNGEAESATDASHGGTGWETLTFDFSVPKDNTAAANGVFGRILFFPLWNGAGWDPAAVTTTYYDNIKGIGYTGTPPEDPAPTDTPATPPTFNANNVISLYSDAYTAAAGINNVPWDDSAFEEVSIAGNNVLKISGTNFLGIDLDAHLDATNMTHLHMDYWIATDWETGQVLNPKLSNHAAQAGETNALDISNPINSQAEIQNWQSKDFALDGDRESIKQFLITEAGFTDLYYLDNVYLYVEGTAGLEDNNIIDVSVYPNPSNSIWNFRTGNTVITSVEVFNLLGKRVVLQNNNSANVAISTQGLTSGIYIARITTEQGTKSVKLIKE